MNVVLIYAACGENFVAVCKNSIRSNVFRIRYNVIVLSRSCDVKLFHYVI
jgi:hypothetical protein